MRPALVDKVREHRVWWLRHGRRFALQAPRRARNQNSGPFRRPGLLVCSVHGCAVVLGTFFLSIMGIRRSGQGWACRHVPKTRRCPTTLRACPEALRDRSRSRDFAATCRRLASALAVPGLRHTTIAPALRWVARQPIRALEILGLPPDQPQHHAERLSAVTSSHPLY